MRARRRTPTAGVTLAVGVLLLAQCTGDGGEPGGGDGAAPTTSEAAVTAAAGPDDTGAAGAADPGATGPDDPGATGPDGTGAAGASDPGASDTGATGASDPGAAGASDTGAAGASDPAAAEAAAPTATTGAEQVPAPSGPPPVAVGTMPELRIDAGGHPHALFAAGFFSGPVDGFSAASHDTTVATAGVSPPDMLIVAPVSRGATSVTVTASGPGGTATQTFTVRVETGADQSRGVAAPAPAPPAPAPPAPAPSPTPPAPAPPAPPATPEELPTLSGQPDDSQPAGSDPDAIPNYALATEAATEAPTVSSNIALLTIIVGQSRNVNVSAHFRGLVQGWAVSSSAPTSVSASISASGVVSLSGNALGFSTITVTASNDIGSVQHAFTVSVKTESQAILTTVGARPQLVVAVGRTISVDLGRYFSEAATEFDVTYDAADPNRLIDVTVQGSSASIEGLRAGTVTISLVATSATAQITRPATVQVTP